jgi:hypothetical protein
MWLLPVHRQDESFMKAMLYSSVDMLGSGLLSKVKEATVGIGVMEGKPGEVNEVLHIAGTGFL